jgi:hypothetical protein
MTKKIVPLSQAGIRQLHWESFLPQLNKYHKQLFFLENYKLQRDLAGSLVET